MAQSPTPSATPSSPAAQVRLNSTSLFTLQGRVGAFSAEERAEAASRRLKTLAQSPEFDPAQDLTVRSTDESAEILAADQVILTLTPQDAAEREPQDLASRYRDRIQQAIAEYRQTHSSQHVLQRSIYVAIATAILLILLVLIRILFPRFHAKLHRWKGTRIRAIKIQSLELLSEDRIVGLLIGTSKVLRQPLILGIFYLYALVVLGLFPGTKGIAQQLLDYLIAAVKLLWQGFLAYLPNLAVLIVIGAVAYYVTKFFKLILSSIERGIIGFPGFYQEWARPTYQIAKFLIITGAIAVAVPYLPGSGSPALQGISIFLGIFVSLGATAVVANVFAGLALTYTRAFHVGDRVKIADTTGDVVERTFLVTRVCTPKNVVVTIPNSMVLANHIVNFSAAEDPAGLILHTSVTLGYDVPWPQVHDVLINAALATQYILPEPSPFVLQTSLDDFYVSYELNAYTDQPSKMTRVYSELHQQIQDHCNRAGIEILSPHYAAVRDGHQTTIPEDYLPKDYTAPGFRFNPLASTLKPEHPNGQP